MKELPLPWPHAQVWDLFYNAAAVRELLRAKIKEESLRTYLFSYSAVYDSLSLAILAEMFELDQAVVHSTISKMIITEELQVLTAAAALVLLLFLSDRSGWRLCSSDDYFCFIYFDAMIFSDALLDISALVITFCAN